MADINDIDKKLAVLCTDVKHIKEKTDDNAEKIVELEKSVEPLLRFVNTCSTGRKALLILISSVGTLVGIVLGGWAIIDKIKAP